MQVCKLQYKKEKGTMDVGIETLTQPEVERLIVALIRGNGPSTEAQMAVVVDWAKETRINDALLGGILDGSIVPSIQPNGELAFALSNHDPS